MRKPDLDDPDMALDMVMTVWPETIAVFIRHKMVCIGCMINPFHTVIDACQEYGLNEDLFRAELRDAIKV